MVNSSYNLADFADPPLRVYSIALCYEGGLVGQARVTSNDFVVAPGRGCDRINATTATTTRRQHRQKVRTWCSRWRRGLAAGKWCGGRADQQRRPDRVVALPPTHKLIKQAAKPATSACCEAARSCAMN